MCGPGWLNEMGIFDQDVGPFGVLLKVGGVRRAEIVYTYIVRGVFKLLKHKIQCLIGTVDCKVKRRHHTAR